MNFKVINIKKKFFIIFIVSFIVIISFFICIKIFFNNSNEISIPTMTKPETSQYIKSDLNSDGSIDMLYVLSKNDKYYIEANISDKTYFLNEKRPLNTLGNHYEYWPISINILDISRDLIPEILIQSSENNYPIQHIYTFDNYEYNDIFCSTNNILGILDSNNTKSPKFLSFDLNNPQESLQKHMLTSSVPKNISYENLSIPAFDCISKLIDYLTIETLNSPDIFLENNSDKNFDTLYKLNKSTYSYIFQDAFFKDTAWDNNGNVSNCLWQIRLKQTTKTSKEDSLINITVRTKKLDSKFLIDSIKIF